MASFSSRSSCFHCEESTSDNFRNGWRLRSCKFAQLCHLCASVYEADRFCETFHRRDDGWRYCESCGKLSGKSWSIVDVLYHSTHICCWILVELCAWSALRRISFLHGTIACLMNVECHLENLCWSQQNLVSPVASLPLMQHAFFD
ncbi:uncharacterized protein LOC107781729 isoform X1 [Nicotiana tabacum]|uniref:Uncharacterized protein LOC107781729 isoform X1 n=1 Tax=Nicotiana tabacum TaxID=4097 RepID=A0AC58SDW9_TOBAC